MNKTVKKQYINDYNTRLVNNITQENRDLNIFKRKKDSTKTS